MLTIRKEQYDALAHADWMRFEDVTVAHLRAHRPDVRWLADEDFLRGLIRKGTRAAATYSVTDEMDVKRYLEYAVEFGVGWPSSDRFSSLTQLFEGQFLSGTEKMNEADMYYCLNLVGGTI